MMGPVSNRGAFLILLSKYGSRAGKNPFSSGATKAESLAGPGSFPLRPTGAGGRVHPVGGLGKRCFDIAGSLTALILMAPAMLLIAAAIYLTTGRPVFLVEKKVGYGGIPFGSVKFRTTVFTGRGPDTENVPSARQGRLAVPEQEWFGRILRRSGLDDLPQLINVLLGHMSCVGPCPLSPLELERQSSHEGIYLAAKPGLTGLWQIKGRAPTDAGRVICDRYYVHCWSLALDFAILARTMRAMLK